jgi:hypothetical protein
LRSDGPSVRLAPAPAVIPEASAHEPSSVPAEGEPGLETVLSNPPVDSPAPAVAGSPVPVEWHGPSLDGHWHNVLARLHIAWRRRWADRAEAYQSAGLPRDLAEYLAYRWTVEEVASV